MDTEPRERRVGREAVRQWSWSVFCALWGAVVILTAGCNAKRPLNVVVVTFDTTRADHIGCYGNAEASTPNVDALAAAGVRFQNAFAAVPITLPSHTTLMTGLDPLAHGIRDNGLFTVADDVTTLAEILRDHGYRTGAAVGSFPLGSQFRLDQGFEMYDDRFAAQFEDFRGRRVLPKTDIFFDERRAQQVNEAAFPWLRENSDQPFLLWLHYFDPHQPVMPPPPYDQLFLDDPYLGEIAYADEAFGRLMEELHELGVADRTLVVFASDHGEGLGDHGEETHSLLAYNSTLRVPLIFRVPGGPSDLTVETRVGLVDVTPTVIDLLGIGGQFEFQGRSLRPELEGHSRLPAIQYAETLSPRLSHALGELRVLFEGDHKFIFGPRPELFDLGSDPRELDNLVDSKPEKASEMKATLEDFLAGNAAEEPLQPGTVDEESRRRLEALGYLTSAAESEKPIKEVLRSEGLPPQDRVGDVNLMSRAKQLLFENKSHTALEAAAELLRRQPGDPMALEMLATASLQLGKIDEAVKYLEELRSLYPEGTQLSAKLALQLGALMFYRGSLEEALVFLDDSQTLKPSAEGHYLISLVAVSMGDAARERSALEASLDLDPSYAPARAALAVSEARLGHFAEAERQFRRAVADQPYFAMGHYNLGAFLVDQNRLEESVSCFKRAVELDPGYTKPLLALVALSVEFGRDDEARRWFDRLLEQAPEGPDTVKARAIMVDA